MRSFFPLAVTIMLFSGELHAQRGFVLAAQAGPQRTDMHASDIKTENRWGYTVGIGALYGLTSSLGAGMDVMYSNEGRRMNFRSPAMPDAPDFRERIGYLKMPLYAAYTFLQEGRVSFTARLGPTISVLLHAEGVDAGPDSVILPNTNPAYTKVNLGAMAGFDLNLRLTQQLRISAGLRADLTFTDTEKRSLYHPQLDAGFTSNRNYGTWLRVLYLLPRHSHPNTTPARP